MLTSASANDVLIKKAPAKIPNQKTKIAVYFHGNAEDVSSSYDFSLKMSLIFRCNVLAMEYPGYGLYKQESPSAELISQNAKLVIDYLLDTLGYD